MKKEIKIEGMRCPACSKRVEGTLNEISGVKAEVDLKKGTATVLLSADVADSVLKDEIESLGFDVIDIKAV